MSIKDQRIQHFVVLMLENRSFDHMLGYLRGRARPMANLSGTETVPIDLANPASGSATVAMGMPYLTRPRPENEFDDTMYQLFGTTTPSRPYPSPAPMNGIVDRYRTRNTLRPDQARSILDCFDPDAIPALSTLAQQFAVFDHWFSSVPGPTWPNRFFAHCGTSKGTIKNPVLAGLMSDFDMPTSFEAVIAAGHDWRVYYGDIPQVWGLKYMRSRAARRRCIKYDPTTFAQDCLSSALPEYVFIEPTYFSLFGSEENDEHGGSDVRPGETLLADIYEALRNSPLWATSALLVTYDEHGGYYDHLAPPSAAPPRDGHDNDNFGFDLYGVRVPAILVSPFVARGDTVSTECDHTAIIGTLRDCFGLLGLFTERDQAAPSCRDALSLHALREDTPTSLPRIRVAPEPKLVAESTDIEPGSLHESLVALATYLDPADEHLLMAQNVRPALASMNLTSAGEYVRKVADRFQGRED